jgi:hypothetical protein
MSNRRVKLPNKHGDNAKSKCRLLERRGERGVDIVCVARPQRLTSECERQALLDPGPRSLAFYCNHHLGTTSLMLQTYWELWRGLLLKNHLLQPDSALVLNPVCTHDVVR